MSHPGDQGARLPQNWQRQGSGHLFAGMTSPRNPVRGFPPTPGSPGAEYSPARSSGWNGSGERHGEHVESEVPWPGTAADVITAGHARPGAAAVTTNHTGPPGARTDGSVRGSRTWNTDWGGGPWASSPDGGSWAASLANGNGVTNFADGSTSARTWTYGEDEPTETWTLRGYADAEAEAEAGSSRRGRAAARQTGDAQAGSSAAAPAASALAPPATPDRGRRRGKRAASQRASGRARRGRLRIVLVASLAIVAAAALAATAAYVLTRHGQSPHASATPGNGRPSLVSTPSPSVTLGPWKHIDSRVDDPVPLTLAELFPAQVSADGRNYTRVTELANTSCGAAVFGSQLKAAVHRDCSQAMRASYLSSDGKRMGTIGVLNLATSAAAAKVGKIVAAPRQFIEPLPTAHGHTRNLGKGTGVVWAVAKGHYLILMWAQYASLQSPTTSGERNDLMQFLNDLYQKTVNQSLTGRMVTGRPLTP
jgi:hypothetical protein